jgi:large subunit ribosomal protein L5e
MAFQKVVKNRAYFKRFQTKYRRRREGKTDYRQRLRLVIQDKNKYNAPKYRLVVRITNRDIICQIVYSRIDGDHVMSAAYSHELPRYGVKLGLTNYSAAYATGLLVTRRLYQKLGMDKLYKGVKVATGASFKSFNKYKKSRPFKALLDVGLVRTTTGNRVFAAMKGALDGGLNVPHSERRLVGWDDEEKKLDSEVLRSHIFGGHVADYMRKLLDEDPEAYDRQFSRYKKEGITPDQLEEIYKKAHSLIRKDPTFHKKERKTEKPKSYRKVRLTAAERKERVAAKKLRLGFPKPKN